MWSTIQIIFAILGILLVLGGDKFSIPLLGNAGMACFGFVSILIGWQAIVTQRIVLGRRRHGLRQTYTGVTAILQGVEFNLFGLFLIVVAILIQMNANVHAVGEQMARHPGIPLIVFGMICLVQSVITLIGSKDTGQNSRWVEIFSLLLARLLPGIVLVVLGLGAVGLGVFEIVAPNAFDQIGGRFLEVLYGLK